VDKLAREKIYALKMTRLKGKVLLAIPMIALAFITLSQPIQAATTTISIDPSDTQIGTAYVDQAFQINLNIGDVENLWGWCVSDLCFNSSVLQLTDVIEGSFLKQGGNTLFVSANSSQILAGKVPEISCVLLENRSVSGSGILATLTFKVVSAGGSQITLSKTKLLNPAEGNSDTNIINNSHEAIESTSVNGNVTVILESTQKPSTDSSNLSLTDPFTIVLYAGIATSVILVVCTAIFLRRGKQPK